MSSKVQCGDNLIATNTYGKVSVSTMEHGIPAGGMWDDFHVPDEWEVESAHISDGVTYVTGFSDTTLSEVTIPESVEEIGNEAFAGCLNLEEVDLPEGVVIGDSAFAETGLSDITIPKGSSVGESAFENCDNLNTVEIHSKEIGDFAFRGSSVKHLSIGNEVRKIGDEAFAHTNLKETVMMTGVASVGEESFYGTKAEIVTNDNVAAVLREEGINARTPRLRDIAQDAIQVSNSIEVSSEDSKSVPIKDEIAI